MGRPEANLSHSIPDASNLRIPGGAILHDTGSYWVGVDLIVPSVGEYFKYKYFKYVF